MITNFINIYAWLMNWLGTRWISVPVLDIASSMHNPFFFDNEPFDSVVDPFDNVDPFDKVDP